LINLAQVIEDTQSLIRIDSQNPGIQEAACGQWVGNRLSDMGLDVKTSTVEGTRQNLQVTVPGEADAPRLILLGHLDTVPIGEGWSVPPLGAEIKDDLIYGRGSCDMKGGVAVSLGLVEALVKRKAGMRGDLVFVATVDEEAPDMAGAQHLVNSGFFRPDDQVLALEPTGTRLRIAQMGLRWLSVKVTGKMAHAGRAHLGIDSAHVMARIIDQLKHHIDSLEHEDEILGKARFTCGLLQAGVATNVVPPNATASFDVRIVPPMDISDVIPTVTSIAENVLRDFPGASFSIEPLGAPRPPVRASDDSPIVSKLRQAYLDETGARLEHGGADGHEAYTDSSMVAALTKSKSCTVFGPGSTDKAHTADEFVPIKDLDLVSRVLWKTATDW
jgi:succinyl-diaminopimelate desuccinylase